MIADFLKRINFLRLLDFYFGPFFVVVLKIFSSTKKSRNIKKVLIIKLAAAGDTLILSSVLNQLQDRFAHVKFDWLVSDVNFEVAQMTSCFSLHVWNRRQGMFNFLKLITKLRRQNYDLVIDFEQWSRISSFIALFCAAPICLGFDTAGQHRSLAYTHCQKKRTDRHEILEFIALSNLFCALENKPLIQENANFSLQIKTDCTLFSDHNFSANNKKVLIHLGCGSDGLAREWPVQNYVELALWLQKNYAAHIYLTGHGSHELGLVEEFNKSVQSFDFSGRLNWQKLAALVKKMDLVISGNTGVMHLAAAFKKNQLALHGPTDFKIWGPLNPNAIVIQSSCSLCPCLRLGFEYHRWDQSCMQKISVSTLQQSIENIWRTI